MLKAYITESFKHTTTLFSLPHHNISSRERRVIVDQVRTNYHGGPIQFYNQGSTFLAVKKASALTLFTAKNVEPLGLYPIHNSQEMD